MSGKEHGNRKGIPPSVSQQIDENLKRLYSDAEAEELPKSLTDLLEALRKQDAQKATDKQ
ncbi:NepR family anti-sigma factor [Roseinatronobacter alkalisoli]|uniref:NepR family anti-sigma factor n=1 Tax=Roseinatronobacter alkalisoli TaxID=3028235 RepID=A0ABT5T8N5_9RHOB|nr:NepR family anti-sigma factor [Roseinatronobacter sp. HJB301]MDD7971346.1 NepR family anti-sigma factor [Roseinatronobacter sp. HJB301]